MITDPAPRSGVRRTVYGLSDATPAIPLPSDDRLRTLTLEMESALSSGTTRAVRTTCAAFLREAAEFYRVPEPEVRVLAARPLRVYERGSAELFGDYDLKTTLIRVWMRTAVQHRVTSFGTFVSTLCHEFCHHLDLHMLGFSSSPHTRGFYQRTAILYHHCRATPLRPLVWRQIGRGLWQVDWSRMARGQI